ncbi:MCR_0457 family protein [Moraxella oblonga]|uniref:MCR_0457 family protein n=1 Tax=Moraxella oblonga TaxID=200413 RepID=UPI00082E4BE4|nr:hypothetical protein [Moraxella oblonga]
MYTFITVILCMKKIPFALMSYVPFFKKCLTISMTAGLFLLSFETHAHGGRGNPKPLYIVGQDSAVTVTVSQYELALVQVLSEICPAMLTKEEREQFNEAYHRQLQKFIPRVDNPSEILRRLSGQQEYRLTLQNVRSWTATYPDSENRALCQELAQKTHSF